MRQARPAREAAIRRHLADLARVAVLATGYVLLVYLILLLIWLVG